MCVCVLYRYGQAKKRKIEHLFKEVEGNLYTIFLVFHHVATHSAVLVVKLGLTAVYMTQYARIHTRDLLWSFIMFCALSCKCLPNRNRSLISCLPVRRRPMPFDMNILQCLLSDFLYFLLSLRHASVRNMQVSFLYLIKCVLLLHETGLYFMLAMPRISFFVASSSME